MPGREMLRINTRVSLVVEEGPYRGNYSTLIEDVNGDTVTLATPLVDRRPVPIRPGDKVAIQILSSGVAQKFNGTVADRSMEPVPLIRVTLEGIPQSIHRRRFVRIEVELPFYFRDLNDPASLKKPMVMGTTKDISGSGALVVSSVNMRQLPPGAQLEIEIVLPGRRFPIRGKARVSRMWSVQSGLKEIQNIAIEFTELENQDREDIIKFVLEKQRELRRKGLI
ncbi:MAG TPA: hypothetical protein GX509_01970 [Firmicutes bacterium]|nr:hypothetical protein [Bacillota bacterium]